jgi:glycerophosphoryl diester phosphodiesterase
MNGEQVRPANRVLNFLKSSHEHPLIFAHRGASAIAPENTIEAAERGLAAGAVGWELDVRLTRDGIPVVIHDASLERTTNVTSKFATDPRTYEGSLVADFDLDEIRMLDAGSWFVAQDGGPRSAAHFGTLTTLDVGEIARFTTGSVRVPTLAECLAFTARHDWLVNVELKTWPDPEPRLLPAVLSEIERIGMADMVLISSFDHDDVAHAARSRSGVATGVLTVQPIHEPARYVRELVGADCYHPSFEAVGASAEGGRGHLRRDDLRTLRERGVPVLCYTVNDARPDGLADRLAQVGVSAFFTDDPAGLNRLFRSR